MPPCAGTIARTVQKHPESIGLKLGVETCTAAAMRVLAACDQSPVRKRDNLRMKSGSCALITGADSY